MKNLYLLASASTVLLGSNAFCANKMQKTENPNVIIIFTDDQGFQDLGCYGSPLIKTPNIDKMAADGIRFTNFYVSASISSPSRASLLTGRLPARNGLGNVLFPNSMGLDFSEITIADLLKTNGYKTACFGKWHIGDLEGYMPTDRGFDEYMGIPFSNDMYISPKFKFAKDVNFREGYTFEKAKEDQQYILQFQKDNSKLVSKGLRDKCPLLSGNEIVEYPCDQSTLTMRYFDHAINFIKNADQSPFFIYITPAMPHIPLAASTDFRGKSKRGLYGDVVEEIDYNVGKLLNYLKENELDKNTLVIFTSDNGPWLGQGENAGSALPFRDGKFSIYEGGLRVPCIMQWTDVIPKQTVSHDIVSTLDLLPTIAKLTKTKLPAVQLDGMDISKLLSKPKKSLGRNTFYYSKGKEIWGIRKGDWKYLPHGGARNANINNKPELYNLKNDISEKNNLAATNPGIVKTLQKDLDNYINSLK